MRRKKMGKKNVALAIFNVAQKISGQWNLCILLFLKVCIQSLPGLPALQRSIELEGNVAPFETAVYRV